MSSKRQHDNPEQGSPERKRRSPERRRRSSDYNEPENSPEDSHGWSSYVDDGLVPGEQMLVVGVRGDSEMGEEGSDLAEEKAEEEAEEARGHADSSYPEFGKTFVLPVRFRKVSEGNAVGDPSVMLRRQLNEENVENLPRLRASRTYSDGDSGVEEITTNTRLRSAVSEGDTELILPETERQLVFDNEQLEEEPRRPREYGTWSEADIEDFRHLHALYDDEAGAMEEYMETGHLRLCEQETWSEGDIDFPNLRGL